MTYVFQPDQAPFHMRYGGGATPLYHISHACKESYRTIPKTIKKLRSQDLKISGAKLRGTGSDIKG
ncbi:hypothetical protein EDO6_00089 [Paenibacillus xylanexedens]|nr:hypothetical protein EDO6_00089 [Paenibacillus xylanexedens]